MKWLGKFGTSNKAVPYKPGGGGHHPSAAPTLIDRIVAASGPESGEWHADEAKMMILPEGIKVEPGPLPVEAQVLLRVMGEDLDTATELIKGMRPVDRAILKFYLSESAALIYKVDEEEGRY